MDWPNQLRDRLDDFQPSGGSADGLPVSIKVRVTAGCFHREHSPEAYRIIDERLRQSRDDTYRFEEHESGPEILLILAATTAGLTLAKSVIDLVTAIIKTRADGQKKGDHPREPLELIVRGFSKGGKLFDEVVLRIGQDETPSPQKVERALNEGLKGIPIKGVPAKRRQLSKQKPKRKRK